MRPLVLLLVLLGTVPTARSQNELPALYAAVVEAKTFIVGAENALTGLHRFARDTSWTHLGWETLRDFGVAADPHDPSTLYLAAGNGVLRSDDGGTSWRVTTGWEVTEVLDVAVDPNAPGHVLLASAYGVWRSPDRGETWTVANGGIEPLPFTQSIAVDRTRAGRVLVGSEHGLYLSTDGGAHWTPVGPRDVPIRSVRQSAAEPGLWLAGTQDHGVLRSIDGGATWEATPDALGEETVYAVAFDPADPNRVAAMGFHTGSYVSTDGGRHWQHADGLADASVHALAFDPVRPGRLWAGTIGRGVYASDDGGRTWTHKGLAGATVYELVFIGGTP